MKLYLCARWGRRDEVQQVAEWLKGRGYTILSEWHRGAVDEHLPDDGITIAGGPEQKALLAVRDLQLIRQSDVLVGFNEEPGSPWSRGGRHREIGFAIGLCKRVWLFGPEENLFDYAPGVRRYAMSEFDIKFPPLVVRKGAR